MRRALSSLFAPTFIFWPASMRKPCLEADMRVFGEEHCDYCGSKAVNHRPTHRTEVFCDKKCEAQYDKYIEEKGKHSCDTQLL